MPAARTFEELSEIISKKNLKLINIYSSKNKSGKWRRRIDVENEYGYIANGYIENIMSRKTSFFDVNNKYTLYNIFLFLINNNKTFELLEENSVYEGNHTLLKFHCNVCNEDFEMNWKSINKGCNCSICSGQQVSPTTCLAYLRPEFIQQWISSKRNLTPYDVTEFSTERVLWRCLKCKHEWETSVVHRTLEGTDCPGCKQKSKGEKSIKEYLENNNIEFKREYRFLDCRYKLPLPFDFYLPNYNLLIEYHGRQHYDKTNGYFGGQEALDERKTKDKIKRDYCKNNNIELIEIPYWEFKNIENILNNYFGK